MKADKRGKVVLMVQEAWKVRETLKASFRPVSSSTRVARQIADVKPEVFG